MKKILCAIFVLFVIQLGICQEGEALYISIENIGNYPIVFVSMGLSVYPQDEDPYYFQMQSLINDPSSQYLQIDWDNPISIGGTYDTPLISELPEDASLYFKDFGVSGPNIGTSGTFGGSGHSIVADLTTWTEYNSDIDFGYTFAFNSGGAPVPEPAIILLIGTGLVGFAGAAIRKKFKK